MLLASDEATTTTATRPVRRPKVLSLSLVYPNPSEPGLGLFVRSRLQHLAALADVEVIAPVPVVDYSNPKGNLFPGRAFGAERQDGPVRVHHPYWCYPPGGTPMNVAALAGRLIPLVARIRKRFPFDLIDTHFGYPEGVTGALLGRWFGKPFTITMRGSEPMFAGYGPRRRAMEWAFRRAARVITVSEPLRELAGTLGADLAKVTKIPNGVDGAVFHPRDREACRRKLGVSLDARLVLSVGEQIEAKGHHHVVGAVARLLERHPNVEVAVAGGVARGGARYDEQIQKRIADLGMGSRVRMLGWVDRTPLAEWLSAADVMCLASYTEGWPNVVNEALSCGTQVVATRVGAVPEMVPSEEYGFMVPPREEDPLREALDAALSREPRRDRIAAWGRTRSWEQVAREVYGEIEPVVFSAGK